MSFRVVRVRMEYTVHVSDTIPEDQTIRAAIDAEIPFTLDVSTTGEIVGSVESPPPRSVVVRGRP